MKNKLNVIIILLTIMIMSLIGCSRYEKDKSYTTDLYGSYLESIETSNISYSRIESYTFNSDNTYNHIYKEIIDGTTNNDFDTNGKILSFEEVNNDITKITLDNDNILYKHKNMLGSLYEIEIPTGKTFDLVIPTPSDNWTGSYPNAANVFDENGFYHSCLDTTNCNDTEENHIGIYYKYIRKNDIVYFIDPDIKNMNYQILYYVVDNGLFFPQLYKEN